jgi:hypothetical protein
MESQGVRKAITTVAAVSSAALASPVVVAGLGAAAVICLILMLIMKELSTAELESGKPRPRLKFFASCLNTAIAPLLLVFVVIVAVKVWQVL